MLLKLIIKLKQSDFKTMRHSWIIGHLRRSEKGEIVFDDLHVVLEDTSRLE